MKKLIVAIAAIALLSGTAYAAEWNFYGSARVNTFYSKVETIGTAGDTTSLDEGLQGNARIGATVKVSDELTGGFEYGASGGNANIRKLYGEWNFGAGSFLVGQTYTPLNMMYSNQVFGDDTDMLAYGAPYSGRAGMLQLTFGGFKIALVTPNTTITTATNGTTGVAANTLGTVEVKIPAIEAKYSLKMDKINLDLAAGYNSFELNNKDVDSYVVALGATAKVAQFFAAGTIFTGQNAGNLLSIETDVMTHDEWDDGYATWNGTTVVDNDQFGFSILAGYNINDMFTLEAGYGYVETDSGTATTADDEATTYYVNMTVNLAPGVFFVPEIGKIDGNESGDGEVMYYGAKWQINF